jgi:hypothetical protein
MAVQNASNIINPAGDNNQKTGKPDQKIATKSTINFSLVRLWLI